MALGKKILGLTVEIGASTSKLDKALDGIKRESKNLSEDLKTVNQLLKFDPKNTELQAQKMNLLAASANNSERRMKVYEKAQEAVNKALKDGAITASQAQKALDEISDEIKKAGNESKKTTAEFDAMGKGVGELSVDMKDAGKNALSLGTIIKGNLISSAVTTGLKTVGSLVKGIATGLWNAGKAAAQWAVNFGKSSLEAGANLKEVRGSTARLFEEEDARTLNAWATQGARTMGLSKSEALQQANTIGNLFINKGIDSNTAAYNSMMMAQRAADIGANFNMETSDVLTYFQQMLKGVYSGADAIGIVTNASAIAARAMQDKLQGVDTSQIIGYDAALEEQRKAQEKLNKAIETYGTGSAEADEANKDLEKSSDKLQKMLKKYVGELTDADKAMAAFNVSMEQTLWTQGTFEEESKGYSGALKVIKKSIENIKETVGEALLPAAEAVLGTFSSYLQGEKGQALVASLSEFLGGMSQSVADWITGGGLNDLQKHVGGIAEKIIGFFSEENKQTVQKWLDTELPKVAQLATSALEHFISFTEGCKGILDWLNNKIEAQKAGSEAYDEAKKNGGSTLYALQQRSYAIKETEAEQKGEKWIRPEDRYHEDFVANGRINLGSDPTAMYFDEFGNYIGDAANDLKQGGQALSKEETKITKDAEKFAKDTPAAMDTAVRGVQSGADGASKISLGAWWKKLEEFTQVRKALEHEAYLASLVTMPEGGSGGSGGSGSGGSSSSGGIGGAWNTIKTAYQTMLQKLNPSKKYATGGVTLRGVPTMVGEAGREIEIPAVNGNVLSHWQTEQLVHAATTNHYNNSGGNITLHQTINVSGSTAGQGQRLANDFVSALRRKGINPTKI